MGNNKISVLIMTHNSEKTVQRTLESVRNFDEVIVVDGGSSDTTLDILKKFNVKILHRKFDGFSNQRNFLIDQASNNWCLMLDSDEAVTLKLKEKLYQTISLPTTYPLYRIMRTEYLSLKEIKSGHGRSDYQERFFQKSRIRYVGDVHEYPVIDQKKEPVNSPLIKNIDLDCRILHNPDLLVADVLKKIAPYSIFKAQERIKKGQKVYAITIVITFIGTFLKMLIHSRKEGPHGLIAALLEAYHRSMVKLLIYEHHLIKKIATNRHVKTDII